jgi:hypothetical protein
MSLTNWVGPVKPNSFGNPPNYSTVVRLFEICCILTPGVKAAMAHDVLIFFVSSWLKEFGYFFVVASHPPSTHPNEWAHQPKQDPEVG